MHEEEDLQLLITLDDPWNARECDTFDNLRAERPVASRPDPTSGRHDHPAGEMFDYDSYQVSPDGPAGKGHHHELY